MNKVYSRNYRFKTLVKFAVPSIFMQIFLSLYTIADGMFVSRLAGTVALSAINIIYLVVSLALALAIMLTTRGSAIVGIQLVKSRSYNCYWFGILYSSDYRIILFF